MRWNMVHISGHDSINRRGSWILGENQEVTTTENCPDRREERRAEPRRVYPITQQVAFHDESKVPTKEMFQAVLCHDISTSGISFYLSGPPDSNHCTLALGRAPRLIYVAAEVVHYGPYEGPNQEWVIGCRFLKKVSLPANDQDSPL